MITQNFLFSEDIMCNSLETHTTAEHFSPHDLLPVPEPATYDLPMGYFYHNVVKHLVRDTVKIMSNGIHIDLDRVIELEATIDQQLQRVADELASNPLIAEFQQLQHGRQIKDYISDRQSKLRTIDHYLKPFKHSDMTHRSYFMHLYATRQGIPLPSVNLPGTSITKWDSKTVNLYAKTRPLLQRIFSGDLVDHPLITEAMTNLAQDKCDIYNQKYLEQIQQPDIPIPAFNPSSSKQKQELFTWLGIKSDKISKDTGLPSWDRDAIETINRETSDEHIKHFTQCFIDHSFAAIIRNNFIEAFYKYTVNNRLYGNYKLFGTKTLIKQKIYLNLLSAS